jgi:hypothetical protein
MHASGNRYLDAKEDARKYAMHMPPTSPKQLFTAPAVHSALFALVWNKQEADIPGLIRHAHLPQYYKKCTTSFLHWGLDPLL